MALTETLEWVYPKRVTEIKVDFTQCCADPKISTWSAGGTRQKAPAICMSCGKKWNI